MFPNFYTSSSRLPFNSLLICFFLPAHFYMLQPLPLTPLVLSLISFLFLSSLYLFIFTSSPFLLDTCFPVALSSLFTSPPVPVTCTYLLLNFPTSASSLLDHASLPLFHFLFIHYSSHLHFPIYLDILLPYSLALFFPPLVSHPSASLPSFYVFLVSFFLLLSISLL